MAYRADMVVKQVQNPHGDWCKSGHVGSKTFRIEGASGKESPTRYFQVTSDNAPDVNGIYCEPCLVIANAMKAQK